MKKKIITAAILVVMALIITACDWCFWSFGSPSRQCIEQSVNATATYGANQMHIQLTAMAGDK